MSLSTNSSTSFVLPIVYLSIGGLIYVLFRPDSLRMFTWFKEIDVLDTVLQVRVATLPIAGKLPQWVLFSLPDGIYLSSYVSAYLIIWRKPFEKNGIIWLLLIPSIAVGSEFGQLLGVVPGTFDFTDLFFYAAGTGFPLILYFIYNFLYEKKL